MNTQPIGIFDSGVGGLTVYRALKRALPHENFLYLGDTARLPYGAKTPDTILRYTLQATEKLIQAGIKFLVIACNTATSAALAHLQDIHPELPIMGVIEPGAIAGLNASSSHHLGVIATAATVRSAGYETAIRLRDPRASVVTKATPLLVSLAEEGLVEGDIVDAVIQHYLQEWLMLPDTTRPDTLILGCTHFPVLIDALTKGVGNKMQIIDSAKTIAKSVQAYFSSHPQLQNTQVQGRSQFWVTDGVERFMQVGQVFLDAPIAPTEIELIDLLPPSI